MAINEVTVPLTAEDADASLALSVDIGNPYYIGAKVTVEQTPTGAIVTAIDKDGTTTAVIANGEKGDTGATGATGETGNGIESISMNSDYTMTIEYTNGDGYTTPSIRGEKGEKGDYNRVFYKDASGFICVDYDLI